MNRKYSVAFFFITRLLFSLGVAAGKEYWYLILLSFCTITIQTAFENLSSKTVVFRSGRTEKEQDDKLFFGLTGYISPIIRPIWIYHRFQDDNRIIHIPMRDMAQLPLILLSLGLVSLIVLNKGFFDSILVIVIAVFLAVDIGRTLVYWPDEWTITAWWTILFLVAGLIYEPGFSIKYLGALVVAYGVVSGIRFALGWFQSNEHKCNTSSSFPVMPVSTTEDVHNLKNDLCLSFPWSPKLPSIPRFVYAIEIEKGAQTEWIEVVEELLHNVQCAVIEISYLHCSPGVLTELELCRKRALPTILVYESEQELLVKKNLMQYVIDKDIWKDFQWISLGDWEFFLLPLRNVDQSTVTQMKDDRVILRHAVKKAAQRTKI
jgi:hypothetical protein